MKKSSTVKQLISGIGLSVMLALSSCYSKQDDKSEQSDPPSINISKMIVCYDLLEAYYDVGIMGYDGDIKPLTAAEKDRLATWVEANASSFESLDLQQALSECAKQ
jgi:hypothetical protein